MLADRSFPGVGTSTLLTLPDSCEAAIYVGCLSEAHSQFASFQAVSHTALPPSFLVPVCLPAAAPIRLASAAPRSGTVLRLELQSVSGFGSTFHIQGATYISCPEENDWTPPFSRPHLKASNPSASAWTNRWPRCAVCCVLRQRNAPPLPRHRPSPGPDSAWPPGSGSRRPRGSGGRSSGRRPGRREGPGGRHQNGP